MVKKVVIIGAGAGGIGAALALADKGYNVKLIERNTLGSGSSGRNPGRMGHGFHYADEETAVAYLKASIKVQKKYPGFTIHEDKVDSPLRHGRYMIVKNSNPPKEVILACYEKIKQAYAKLVAEDPTNEVFGPPEKFYRILDPSEYSKDVNMDIIDVGIETNERIFKWDEFSKHIRKVIEAHPNIEMVEHTCVDKIYRNKEGESRFSLLLNKDGQQETVETDFIVNSTWENIELLNADLGINMPAGQRTNRLKTLCVVKLPEALKGKNSMFICMGQYGMVTIRDDDTAEMTFAKVTNIEACTGLSLTANSQRLLDGGATPLEIQSIGQQIIDGVSQYIPEMKHAKIITVKFGIVQTPGELHLNQLSDPNHQFNKRSDHCVRGEQIGLISNPCVKLFYFLDNGEIVLDLIEKQLAATQQIDSVIGNISTKASRAGLRFSKQMERIIREEMEVTSPEVLLSSPQQQLSDKYFKHIQTLNISVATNTNTLFKGPVNAKDPYTSRPATPPGPPTN